jgi:hypothetical protein
MIPLDQFSLAALDAVQAHQQAMLAVPRLKLDFSGFEFVH